MGPVDGARNRPPEGQSNLRLHPPAFTLYESSLVQGGDDERSAGN